MNIGKSTENDLTASNPKYWAYHTKGSEDTLHWFSQSLPKMGVEANLCTPISWKVPDQFSKSGYRQKGNYIGYPNMQFVFGTRYVEVTWPFDLCFNCSPCGTPGLEINWPDNRQTTSYLQHCKKLEMENFSFSGKFVLKLHTHVIFGTIKLDSACQSHSSSNQSTCLIRQFQNSMKFDKPIDSDLTTQNPKF